MPSTIKAGRWAAGYRVLLIGLCLYAILAYSGVLKRRFNGEIFSYYTILSVLLALTYFSALVITSRPRRSAAKNVAAGLAPALSPALAHFKGGVTLAVTITMTVYHFFLAPVIFEMVGYKPFSPNDLIVHYAIPLMVILDWLLFDPKPTYAAADPLRWLSIPLAYFVFAVIRAQLGGELRGVKSRYPYFFIDIDALSLGPVLRNALLLSLGFLVIGYVLYGADRFLGRRRGAGPKPRDGVASHG